METVLLMCGNLGLAGEWEPTRRLLKQLGAMTVAGGLLIGELVDPADPEDLDYQERNRRAGLQLGRVRLRLRYGDLADAVVGTAQSATGGHRGARRGDGMEARGASDEGADHVVVLRRRA